MKYLRLFEEHHENLDVVLSTIDDDNADKIKDYIGFDEKDYEIDTSYYDSRYPKNVKYNGSELTILVKQNMLENLMGVEDGVIGHIQGLTSHYSGNYEYYVDDSELDYIHSYLSGSTLEDIKKLAHKFGFQIDPEEEGEIKELFENLGLEDIFVDIKNEISSEHESAIRDLARDILKKLPFEINYTTRSNKDFELYFNYQEVIDYIKKHNLKVKTIKQFIENCDYDEFGYNLDYSDGKYEFLGDFKEVDKLVRDACEQYTQFPDELFPKLIKHNKIELFKNKIEFADFYQHYKIFIKHVLKGLNIFEHAKHFNNSVLEWFKTYDFQKWFIEEYKDIYAKPNYNSSNYKLLISSEIVDPKIKEEYEYLVNAEKYNL